jgi:integrase
MASLSHDGNGCYRVLFVAPDGRRMTVRLGKARSGEAEAWKRRIERLQNAQRLGDGLDVELAKWVDGLDDRMHDRLSRVGLVRSRQDSTIGAWWDRCITQRPDLKPASVEKLRQSKVKFLGFFDAGRSLRSVTRGEAQDWRRSLVPQNLKEATIRQHCRNAKSVFNQAVTHGLLLESPMRGLVSASVAAVNEKYVTPEEAQRILDACPNLQWRLFFSLARFATCRVPSETHLLTWADVDWERGMLTVHSPKTERHPGKDKRQVVLSPALLALLREARGGPGIDDDRIISLSENNLARDFKAILKRAGVVEWPDLFQTLRRSCRIHFEEHASGNAVDLMMGHSAAIGGKHYSTLVSDDARDKLRAGLGEAAQKAAQKCAALGGIEQKPEQKAAYIIVTNAAIFPAFPLFSNPGGGTRTHDQGIMSPALYR